MRKNAVWIKTERENGVGISKKQALLLFSYLDRPIWFKPIDFIDFCLFFTILIQKDKAPKTYSPETLKS